MTTTTQETVHDNVHEHRSPAQYVMIGGILCGLTAIEICLYYIGDAIPLWLNVGSLLVIAGIKFFLVAAFFMHLKDDPKIFRRWFIIGGCAAIFLFAIVLLTLLFGDHRFF